MKCTCCKKKISDLLMVECSECMASFCITCRLPEVHACPAQVKKAVILPKVVAPKLETI